MGCVRGRAYSSRPNEGKEDESGLKSSEEKEEVWGGKVRQGSRRRERSLWRVENQQASPPLGLEDLIHVHITLPNHFLH